MTANDLRSESAWQSNPEVSKLWPEISGNDINGLGETEALPPGAVFWRTDGSTPHAPVMYYFYEKDRDNPVIAAARKYRERTAAIPIHDVAAEKIERSAREWTESLKAAALEMGADDLGICAWRQDWNFPDRPLPRGKWAVVMAFAHDYGNMKAAPADSAYVEMMARRLPASVQPVTMG